MALSVHVGRAPFWLAVAVPGCLLPIGVLRVVQWWRLDVDRLDDRGVTRRLRTSTVIVTSLSLGFTLWAFALLPFAGNEQERGAIVFFLSIMIVGTMFCLVHLRFAAPLLVALVVAPTAGMLLANGTISSAAVAIDLLVVTIVMSVSSAGYYRDFRRLNQTLEELAELSRAHERAARIDSLTGIGNRREFFGALDDAVALYRDETGGFVVGLIDLDGFKSVNDLHGHAAGDELLAVVAERLRRTLPPHATCARTGGDEFAFLVPDMADPAAAESLGHAICTALADPVGIAAAQVKVGASLGLALCPAMGRMRNQLVEHADYALYHAGPCCSRPSSPTKSAPSDR